MAESNILEYLFESHKSQFRRESDLVALYIHACMLDRKAKLESGSAVLPTTWNTSDPLQLIYKMTDINDHIRVGVTETEGDIFVSITDDVHNRLGNLDMASGSLCKMADTFQEAYFNLSELGRRFNESVWSIVFPKPATPPSQATSGTSRQEPPRLGGMVGGGRMYPPGGFHGAPEFDYGRADLDPFGIGSNPLGIGGGLMGGPGSMGGGMLLDPRRNMPRGPRPDWGLGGPPMAPGAVPPGARFDPIGPPRPGMGGRAPRGPDPDHAMPPGWEDMYM